VLLVSHDRAFLNNVATSTIVFEGDGVVGEYDGGYDDWLRVSEQRRVQNANMVPENSLSQQQTGSLLQNTAGTGAATAVSKARKLSFKEQRELEQMPDRIAQLEKRQRELQAEMARPSFYQGHRETIARVTSELANVDRDLTASFLRWEELEG
jgi:ATP-binding cassette subfamily F protein uup